MSQSGQQFLQRARTTPHTIGCRPAMACGRRTVIESLERRVLMALTAQYFDNPGFSGLTATLAENVNLVNTSGTPAGKGLTSGDTFTTRWTGQIQTVSHSGAQNYTFQTTADDGVRVWVDGQLIINRYRPLVFGDPQPLSAVVSLQPNTRYDIRVEYMEDAGAAEMVLRWITPGTSTPVVVPSSNLFESPTGLLGTYYNDLDFAGSKVRRVDPQVNFSWSGSPVSGIDGETFSVRWSGQIRPDHNQTYTFRTVSDDGVRLWVDNQLLINNWTVHSSTTSTSPTITLQAGKRYDIQLDFYDNSAGAAIQLLWASSGQTGGAFQPVPQANLYSGRTTALFGTENGSAAQTYTNSVINLDRPDPGIIWANGAYWMVHTTGGPATGWPLWTSKDLINWSYTGTELLNAANKPSWMNGSYWAPEIHKVGNQFVLTSTARHATTGRLVIAMASSSSINGPYTVRSTPLVSDSVSVLDSHIFQDTNGKKYLLWKRDGASGGVNGTILLRELDSTGLNFEAGSSAVTILSTTGQQSWEKGMWEAPWMIKRDGYYYLIYSGEFIGASDHYAIGVARSTTLTGLFTRNPANAILKENSTWRGPGHGGFVTDLDGTIWHLYHARPGSNPGLGRYQLIDRMGWNLSTGWPTFGNGGTPTTAATIGPRIVDPSYVFAPVSGSGSGSGTLSLSSGRRNGGSTTRSSFTRFAVDAGRTSPFSVRRLFDDIDMNGEDEDELEALPLSA